MSFVLSHSCFVSAAVSSSNLALFLTTRAFPYFPALFFFFPTLLISHIFPLLRFFFSCPLSRNVTRPPLTFWWCLSSGLGRVGSGKRPGKTTSSRVASHNSIWLTKMAAPTSIRRAFCVSLSLGVPPRQTPLSPVRSGGAAAAASATTSVVPFAKAVSGHSRVMPLTPSEWFYRGGHLRNNFRRSALAPHFFARVFFERE